MRFKVRINKAFKDYAKEIKALGNTDLHTYETLEFVKEKSFLKAKPVIDHLELRSLDASKVAEELLNHYKKNKKYIMYKALIVGILLICMDKCNKKIGNITKNVLAAQADTVITTIILDSLKNHREYDPVIVLTFDLLRGYLDTCRVYEQGVFKEQELMQM
jgi:hypothetical protein